MAGPRIDKVKMQVRTRLKGQELEAELANHMATLRERDRIEEAKKEATRTFTKELKAIDSTIADQRLVLDKGELGTVEVEVVTKTGGKKTYKRLDTNEFIGEEDLPDQMELPEDEDEALDEAEANHGGDD